MAAAYARPRYRDLGRLGVITGPWTGQAPAIAGSDPNALPPGSADTGRLPDQSVPDPSAPILTTMDVNGPSGSVDSGGAVDQCAWWLSAQQQQGWVGQQVQQLLPVNMWSNERFGLPFGFPSVAGTMMRGTILLLGGFLGGFHGYRRHRGKALPTAGYALAGAVFPLVTLGVGIFQGYGKSKGG